MATHKDSKYSVNSRLNDHDAQLLELRNLIASTLLQPGPQGKQGDTGASGADGRNGLHGKDGANGRDSCVPGPKGPVGLQGHRGERGEKGNDGPQGFPGRDGKDGQSIVGPRGEKGDRGDCNIPNTSEVAAALLTIRKAHATFLAKILNDLDLNYRTTHRGMQQGLAEIRARIAKQIEVGGLE